MLFQVSESQDSTLPSTSNRAEIKWPVLHNGDTSYPAEFENGTWRCPFCSYVTSRIRQHLDSHKGLIKDLESAEQFCKEMAAAKRKETKLKKLYKCKCFSAYVLILRPVKLALLKL